MSWVQSVGKLSEDSSPPPCESTSGSSSGVSARVPVRLLVLLGFVLGGYGMISVYQRFLASRFSPLGENLVVVSIGGVTGPDLVSTHGKPGSTPSAQSVSIHRDRAASRHRLRALFGDDRGQTLSHRERIGGGHLRLRQRRQARPLLRHRNAPAAGNGPQRAQPALQEPWGTIASGT